jgi:hypothetical protein
MAPSSTIKPSPHTLSPIPPHTPKTAPYTAFPRTQIISTQAFFHGLEKEIEEIDREGDTQTRKWSIIAVLAIHLFIWITVGGPFSAYH